jgi:hypothetical protein
MSTTERLDVSATEPDPVPCHVLGREISSLDGVVDSTGVDPEQVCGVPHPQGFWLFRVVARPSAHDISLYLIQEGANALCPEDHRGHQSPG